MRIGISCYATYGGSGSVASEIGIALSERGHEVHFFSSTIPPRLNIHHNEVFFHEVSATPYPLFESPFYGIALASRMSDVVDKYKLDIIHAHYAIPHASSALLARMASENKVKIVTTLHGTDITIVGTDPSYFSMVRLAIKQSDAVTAVSEFLKYQTVQTFGVGDHIKVIPNFVCSHPLITSESSAYQRTSVLPKEPTLVHVSNFRPVKKVMDVIKIYEEVRKTHGCKLIMVGDGPDRAEAENYCRQLSFWNDVEFVGKQNNPDIYIQRSTIFLLPSTSESFGLAALEAMAQGVPIVATNTGGLPELIRHEVDGFLHNVGDWQSMTRSVTHLLDNPKLLDKMGSSAKQRALTVFSEAPAIDAYEAIYNKVLS